MPMTSSAFVDLQINGYQGVDFNKDEMSAEELHHACAALERDGVESILATIITDDLEKMENRIKRIVHLRGSDALVEKMIAGFHIEGPFISQAPGYVGAHPANFARAANWNAMSQLLDAGEGLIRIVTLSPEQDSQALVSRRLVEQGVLVAAGHTNATLEELDTCIDAGLTLFTHLGNGCPRLMDRHDNIIQRALSRAGYLTFGVIVDGAHVPYFVLKNYLAIAGIDRVFVVTDAIAAAGCGPGIYQLGGRQVSVGEDGVPRADDDSHLVGSATPMHRMAANLRQYLGLGPSEIQRLTSLTPRRLLTIASVNVEAKPLVPLN